ncbi:unnamed protein product [Phyllotreta striolata]|uniref:Uncharacterized protein n=1 Tax=Phyllotreta striolata TaxID=444603 RepID=A0A9N9TBI7_PHYSR|nr:unnamed protein product [Phyllotreta striolata]
MLLSNKCSNKCIYLGLSTFRNKYYPRYHKDNLRLQGTKSLERLFS